MASVDYQGNSLHKRRPWFGKPPARRNDKSPCPDDVTSVEAHAVLTAAITASLERGLHSVLLDGDHPKYVWGRSSFGTTTGGSRTLVWEACSSSRTALMYHAYPIQPDRHSDTMPDEVEEELWPED